MRKPRSPPQERETGLAKFLNPIETSLDPEVPVASNAEPLCHQATFSYHHDETGPGVGR